MNQTYQFFEGLHLAIVSLFTCIVGLIVLGCFARFVLDPHTPVAIFIMASALLTFAAFAPFFKIALTLEIIALITVVYMLNYKRDKIVITKRGSKFLYYTIVFSIICCFGISLLFNLDFKNGGFIGG